MSLADPTRAGQHSPIPPRTLYFFLSYARSDDDPHVEQFYKDLCGEVRVRAGLASTEEVGFFDTHSIGIGAPWSAELVDALAKCCSFLALCSPRYFLSEPCGREWQLFADRVDHYEGSQGQRSTALIPVLWLPPRRVPAAVRRLQYDSDVFNESYRRSGLRQLMRLQRNRDDYLESLSVLADRIVENAATDPLPPMTRQVDFADVSSAFHPGERAASSPDEPAPATGADHVHFVIAAPNRQEAGAVRRDLDFYGPGSVDWAPYLPSLAEPLASFAGSIAAKRGLTSEVSAVSVATRGTDAAPTSIRNSDTPPSTAPGTRTVPASTRGDDAAATPRTAVAAPASTGRTDATPGGRAIVVLLVDAWATQLDTYRRALAEHEIQQTPAATAMVPRSHEDPETQENWRRLSDGLRSVLLERVAAGEAIAYRPDILSHRAFDEDLQVVLEVARNRVFAQSGPPVTEAPEPLRTRPILEGP